MKDSFYFNPRKNLRITFINSSVITYYTTGRSNTFPQFCKLETELEFDSICYATCSSVSLKLTARAKTIYPIP